MIFYPKINENSRRIVEKIRNSERGNKNEVKLRNKTKSPLKTKPKINNKSVDISNKNKTNKKNETKNINENKKDKIKTKKLNFNNNQFDKRNKSIGNENMLKNKYIYFDDNKNNTYTKNNNDFKNLNNNENNFDLYSYRNSNNTNADRNKTNTSQLNSTLELNNAYKDSYNFIDEKKYNNKKKYLENYSPDFHNQTDKHHEKTKLTLKEKNNKNKVPKKKRPLTPSEYKNNYNNAFDYLYNETEPFDNNKKKKELKIEKYHPFTSNITSYAEKIKNNRRKAIEGIKSNSLNKQIINKKNKNLNPKITNIQKNPIQKNTNNNQKNNYIKAKQKKYKELFDLLDSNKDGLISSSKIHLTKIDSNILRNISPILEELKQSNKEMDFKEFCIKVDKLMN